jgi:fermentation-respiration switch protein FrsA (DUF1100 family)
MLILALSIPAALILLAGFVRWLEPRLAFFPTAGESVSASELGVGCEPLTIETHDGERLRGWSLVDSAARARVLYFHGNGGNLSAWAPVVAGVARQGYSVFAFDYRGYGLSTGRPTEQGLYRDVEAIVDRFWRAPSNVPIVYWGRSLGATMAAYASTLRKPDGVILESGFPDVRALIHGSPLLMVLAPFSTYRFPSAHFVNRLDGPVPVLVLHGDDDHVIPIAQGRALFDSIKAPKRFVAVPGGDHNDVSPPDAAGYWKAVNDFIESL